MQRISASNRKRLTLRCLGSLLALLLASLIGVAQASAGTYTVSACSPTSSTGGWQSVNTFPSGLIVGNMCGGPASGPNEPQGPVDEGALFAEDSTNTTADIPDGAEAGWRDIAPEGTDITSITYWRSLHAYNQQSLVPGLWTGEGTTLESCQSPPEGTHECNSLNNQGPKTFTNLHASSLFFGVRCRLVGGEFCVPAAPGERDAQADLYSATVTLSEAASPTISSLAGAAWGGGTLSGAVPVVLSASDYSGIASVEVRSSRGGVLASVPESCDYYNPVPCPDLAGTTVLVNTAATSDGPQTLILTVRDAAGNTSTSTSPLVTVDNLGPAPPTALAATLAGKEVIVTWSNPASPPIPITAATVALCSTVCIAASTIAATTGSVHIAAPAPGSYIVRLSLTDAAGKTSAPATATLTVPSRSPGGSSGKLRAIIDTHRRLHVSGPIPKGVEAVRVCWRSMRGKRVLGSRCVTLHVERGRIAITFHPSARARQGHITVTVSHGRRLIARLAAAHSP